MIVSLAVLVLQHPQLNPPLNISAKNEAAHRITTDAGRLPCETCLATELLNDRITLAKVVTQSLVGFWTVEWHTPLRSGLTTSVSDGRQPPLTFKLQLNQTAAFRSLDALVRLSGPHGGARMNIQNPIFAPTKRIDSTMSSKFAFSD